MDLRFVFSGREYIIFSGDGQPAIELEKKSLTLCQWKVGCCGMIAIYDREVSG
ncbi:hypothetical protein Plim_2383 [Planctopirus limnophila DSM 3776]|uniref:Uncharacterized protein n=1 Tax=Planctopirus limnophila (strain ATCC 43296 / DSM 3776 / IFAM 1008 / Mu 290) TaxID=521674 RepID=D5SP65_PLAL2|nr:hypothetical protein Plim_2383 [Planctopirus limnophila DSM 3776]